MLNKVVFSVLCELVNNIFENHCWENAARHFKNSARLSVIFRVALNGSARKNKEDMESVTALTDSLGFGETGITEQNKPLCERTV